jgi:Probable Zinc-ribbon domain
MRRCDECDFETITKLQLTRHKHELHGKRVYICQDNVCSCGVAYSKACTLRSHISTYVTRTSGVKRPRPTVQRKPLLKTHALYEEIDFEACRQAGISRAKIDTKTLGSGTLYWECDKAICGCVHKWEAKVTDRALSGTGCPYCRGDKICSHQSLLYKYPGVVTQWHPTLNSMYDPSTISWSASTIIWWLCICDCGEEHVWKTTVNKRTSGQRGCKACTKNRFQVCKCRSLGVVHPGLCLEIDFDKDTNFRHLDEVARREMVHSLRCQSTTYIWWKCSNNPQHPSWCARLDHRSGPTKSGCPTCRESKLEILAAKILTQLGVVFIRQRRFDDDKRLSYDIGIDEMRALIELDGIQHFQPISFGGSLSAEECLESNIERDLRKNNVAKRCNFHLLRVPYTHGTEELMRDAFKSFFEQIVSLDRSTCILMTVDEELYKVTLG